MIVQHKMISKTSLEVYHDVLDNGLNVYVVSMCHKHNIYVTFSTKFGSVNNEFIPNGKSEMVRVPDGVAHFLEHKLFEQKDGVDPFTFFTKNGCDANANTTYDKTTYLFSGMKNFSENLNYLLDYVQEPYFTDENVFKEKGIIDQERSMYQDDPFWRMYEGSINNLMNEHPIKYPIIGTKESIYAITKEDLYTCYNTFYHPSNMFLVVTGNVDYKQVFDIVRNNQANKDYKKEKKITLKKYDEADNVSTVHEEIEMDINISKVAISYKINILDYLKKYSYYEVVNYILYYFGIKLDSTSVLNENLKRDGLIYDDLGLEINFTDKHILISLFAESKNPHELIEIIDNEINNKIINKTDFERKKKCSISSIIVSSDDIYTVNNKIMGNIIKYGDIIYNSYEVIENLKFNDLKNIINNINFSFKSTFIVNPKKQN